MSYIKANSIQTILNIVLMNWLYNEMFFQCCNCHRCLSYFPSVFFTLQNIIVMAVTKHNSVHQYLSACYCRLCLTVSLWYGHKARKPKPSGSRHHSHLTWLHDFITHSSSSVQKRDFVYDQWFHEWKSSGHAVKHAPLLFKLNSVHLCKEIQAFQMVSAVWVLR